MDPENRALSYFSRNPPASSGLKPLPYKKIATLVPNGKVRMKESTAVPRDNLESSQILMHHIRIDCEELSREKRPTPPH